MRISLVEEFGMRKLLEEELSDWDGIFEKAHLPIFSKLSNRTSLIETKTQRKRMKKKEVTMNRRPSDLVDFI